MFAHTKYSDIFINSAIATHDLGTKLKIFRACCCFNPVHVRGMLSIAMSVSN